MAYRISLAYRAQLKPLSMPISRSCSSCASLAAISAHCCHTCLDSTSSSDKQCRAWSAATCCFFFASCCCIRCWALSFAASCCWRAVSTCCTSASYWRASASLSCCGAGCYLEFLLNNQGCLPDSACFAIMMAIIFIYTYIYTASNIHTHIAIVNASNGEYRLRQIKSSKSSKTSNNNNGYMVFDNSDTEAASNLLNANSEFDLMPELVQRDVAYPWPWSPDVHSPMSG